MPACIRVMPQFSTLDRSSFCHVNQGCSESLQAGVVAIPELCCCGKGPEALKSEHFCNDPETTLKPVNHRGVVVHTRGTPGGGNTVQLGYGAGPL
jgi:hypothetical protein